MNRRGFLEYAGSCLLATAFGCGEQSPQSHYRFGYTKTSYLRPPGALPEAEFMKACIQCDLCAQVCDRSAIRFFTEDFEGRVRAHTPYVVAAEAACDLCLACTQVCPTGALMPLSQMENVNMGLAFIEENLCLPYINQGGCGACYTICPVNAVYLEAQRYPRVIEEKCVGCGLCEEVCLQKAKAIRVFNT